jgi:Na+/H+ antiporter NhaD/arsenite permease-like protein
VFFMGLFVMVGALVEVGVISSLAEAATEQVGDQPLLTATLLVFVSGILSAVIDNIPYVATMTPLVQDLVSAGGGGGDAAWWSLALGADLGGNATAVGASANVVVIGIAARNGHPISFWHFTKYGLVVASVTVLLSWIYVALRYFILA